MKREKEVLIKELPDITQLAMAVIHWRGPYDSEEHPVLPSGNGVYIATGCLPRERTKRIQYVGITERSFAERMDARHKTNQIRETTRQFWLGQVVHPVTFERALLEQIEHCLIYFWQPRFNERKKYLPSKSVCFINQWFSEHDIQRIKRPELVRELPDVMWHNEGMWRTGKLRKWELL